MEREEGDLPLEARRHTDIVSVHPGNKGRAGFSDAAIQGGYHPFLFLSDETNPVIATLVSLQECRCVIDRAIVDDDEFKIGEGLAEYAIDCGRKPALAIPDRHQDGNL